MAQFYAAVVLLVLSYLSYGDAIKCWTCTSDLDAHCGDPFNNTSPSFNLHHTFTDCITQSSPQYGHYRTKSVCKKIRQVVNGHPTIIRSCEWLRTEDTQVGECSADTFTSPSYAKVEYCGTCDTDGCNSADHLQSCVVLMSLFPVLLALFLRN